KSGVYYAQAWAFMHYMMHGEHAARFKQYVRALQKGDSDLSQYLNVSEHDLETGFQNYLKLFIQRSSRSVVKVSGEGWEMHIESIPEREPRLSVPEVFLASGTFREARGPVEI